MMVAVTVLKLKYVNEYVDRTGKLRRYFRRGGRTLGPLPGDVGSEEFMAAYQGYLSAGSSKPAPTVRNSEGSFGRLITDYYGSRPFADLKPSSRQTYRYVLEPLAKAHGHRSVAEMTHKHASKLIQNIGAKKPGMANLTKSVLQNLMKYAVKEGWRDDNPFIGIDRYKGGTHHTWTEGEIKAYEKKWRLGTRQRLAFALLLHTGQRVSDVAKMVRGDITPDGLLHVIQEKTGVELYLPIVPELEQAMRAYPARGLALIGREDGRPISERGLSHIIRLAVEEAGLPAKCVAHGLRKAKMRRLAEAGATEKEIAAWSGHTTLREIERYTKAADQKRLAKGGADKMRTQTA
jgi:integrase